MVSYEHYQKPRKNFGSFGKNNNNKRTDKIDQSSLGITIKYIPGTNKKEVIYRDIKITFTDATILSTDNNTLEIFTKDCVCILAARPPTSSIDKEKQKRWSWSSTPPPLPARRQSLPNTNTKRSQDTSGIKSIPRSSSSGNRSKIDMAPYLQPEDDCISALYAKPFNTDSSSHQDLREKFENMRTENTALWKNKVWMFLQDSDFKEIMVLFLRKFYQVLSYIFWYFSSFWWVFLLLLLILWYSFCIEIYHFLVRPWEEILEKCFPCVTPCLSIIINSQRNFELIR